MSKEIRMIEIGIRIRKIRESLKLTQRELAAKINVSGPTMSEFENGKLFPNFDYIYNINRIYGVSLYYVLYGEGGMFDVRESLLTQRLERLIQSNPEIEVMLDYIEKSTIVRYAMLSEFNGKLAMDRPKIEKEISDKQKKE